MYSSLAPTGHMGMTSASSMTALTSSGHTVTGELHDTELPSGRGAEAGVGGADLRGEVLHHAEDAVDRTARPVDKGQQRLVHELVDDALLVDLGRLGVTVAAHRVQVELGRHVGQPLEKPALVGAQPVAAALE